MDFNFKVAKSIKSSGYYKDPPAEVTEDEAQIFGTIPSRQFEPITANPVADLLKEATAAPERFEEEEMESAAVEQSDFEDEEDLTDEEAAQIAKEDAELFARTEERRKEERQQREAGGEFDYDESQNDPFESEEGEED